MEFLNHIWAWLLEPNFNRLITLFGALAGIIYLFFAVYTHYASKRLKPTNPIMSQQGIAAGRDIIAGRDINVNIGITFEQLEDTLKNRGQEITNEISKLKDEEHDRRIFLEKELAIIKSKLVDKEKTIENLKVKLSESYNFLYKYRKDFTPSQLEKARLSLEKGDTCIAEELFIHVLESSTIHAAEAAHQLGVLAETRIDYYKAYQFYQKAVQLKPDNHIYLRALGSILFDLGRYKEAEPFYNKALAIRRKLI